MAPWRRGTSNCGHNLRPKKSLLPRQTRTSSRNVRTRTDARNSGDTRQFLLPKHRRGKNKTSLGSRSRDLPGQTDGRPVLPSERERLKSNAVMYSDKRNIIPQNTGKPVGKSSSDKKMGHVVSSAHSANTPAEKQQQQRQQQPRKSGGSACHRYSPMFHKRLEKDAFASPVMMNVSRRPPIASNRAITTRACRLDFKSDPRSNAMNVLARGGFGRKKIPVVISAHQQSTSNSGYIEQLMMESAASAPSSSMVQQHRRRRRANYFDVNLTARVYTSLSILRSHISGGKHLGSTCDPVIETILLRRDSDQVEKWQRITSPPVYFERVEADANICGGATSPYSFLRQAAHLGLVEPIQNVISHFDALRCQCNNCVMMTTNNIGPAIPEHWWPVGLEGSIQNHRTCMDPELLRISTPAKDSLLDITFLAKNIFKLSDEAVLSVIRKKTSLLYEVSNVCKIWQERRRHLTMPEHVPSEYARTTTLIGPDERFLEVKLGVYYVLQRGTVVKFMTKPTYLTDFVMENAFGYGLQGNVKGTVGVIATCPEAFCVEMEFAGVSLQSVVNGDINCTLNHPRNNSSTLRDQQELIQHHMAPCKMMGALYDVRMLQATGRLPAILQKSCKIPIADSYSAVGVTNMMRKRLLDELPFLTAEIINIITRLSQQGLVNPDIKSDNFVIDGPTGQPKMIDFGLILPAGRRDAARKVSSTTENVYSDYPQTAPEYLNGGKCQEAAMTYGLSYMITDILNTLVSRTGDMSAVNMSVNIPLQAFMAKAYAQDYKDRPRAYLMAPLVGACFPFRDDIAKSFHQPRHTLLGK